MIARSFSADRPPRPAHAALELDDQGSKFDADGNLANGWTEADRKATTSAGAFRVIGSVSNMPEFAEAFSCRAGQPMVRENACRAW